MKFLALLGAVALCCCCCFLFEGAAAFPSAHRPGKLDPNHVPSSACVHMIPGHNDSVASSDPVPYSLTPSATTVSPGDTIQVTVSGAGGSLFKGLYMQARVAGAGVDAVGEFLTQNEEISPAVRISSCPPGEKNAISYISRTGIESIALRWKAEGVPAGSQVYFRATFVESFSRFWVNVDSEIVQVVGSKH